jgi:hypothetical protein
MDTLRTSSGSVRYVTPCIRRSGATRWRLRSSRGRLTVDRTPTAQALNSRATLIVDEAALHVHHSRCSSRGCDCACLAEHLTRDSELVLDFRLSVLWAGQRLPRLRQLPQIANVRALYGVLLDSFGRSPMSYPPRRGVLCRDRLPIRIPMRSRRQPSSGAPSHNPRRNLLGAMRTWPFTSRLLDVVSAALAHRASRGFQTRDADHPWRTASLQPSAA